jgi:hypothetical protein
MKGVIVRFGRYSGFISGQKFMCAIIKINEFSGLSPPPIPINNDKHSRAAHKNLKINQINCHDPDHQPRTL